MKRFFVIAVLLCGCSCEEQHDWRLVEASRTEYELVAWNPPKHFYVDLKDVNTGEIHRGLYISKHFNAHVNLRKGMRLFLVRQSLEDQRNASNKASRFDHREILEALMELTK